MHSSIGMHCSTWVALVAMALVCALLASCGGDGNGNSQGSQGDGTAPTGVTLRLLAGSAGGSGDINGTGTAARFNKPYGIVADSTGNLYVTDGSPAAPSARSHLRASSPRLRDRLQPAQVIWAGFTFPTGIASMKRELSTSPTRETAQFVR